MFLFVIDVHLSHLIKVYVMLCYVTNTIALTDYYRTISGGLMG